VPAEVLKDYPDLGKPKLSPIVSTEEAQRQDREMKARMDKAEAEKKAKYELPAGFLSGNAMARGKAQKALNREVRYGDKVVTRKQFIEDAVAKGKKLEQMTVTEGHGKGTFWILGDYEINQTQADYYNFLTKGKAEPPKPEPKAETLEAKAKAMGLTESQLAQAKKEGVTTELGLRRIEKNTRREKPKPEPKPHKEIAALKPKAAVKQSDRAIAIDRALLAKQVVSVDDPRWLRRPNRFDVRGVDTPGSGRVVSRTGFTDRGKTRMSRKHHRGWKRIKL